MESPSVTWNRRPFFAQCGRKLRPEAKFCPGCGSKIAQASASGEGMPSGGSSSAPVALDPLSGQSALPTKPLGFVLVVVSSAFSGVISLLGAIATMFAVEISVWLSLLAAAAESARISSAVTPSLNCQSRLPIVAQV